MNKLVVVLLGAMVLMGCERSVNGQEKNQFNGKCSAKGGVMIKTTDNGDISDDNGYFCVKKDVIIEYTADY